MNGGEKRDQTVAFAVLDIIRIVTFRCELHGERLRGRGEEGGQK